MRALIIDDEPMPAKHLAEMIKIYCFEVTAVEVFTVASEALEHLQEHSYDILFLDVKMPEINGLKFLEHARLSPGTAVVFVTAFSQFAVDAFNLNVVHYIIKPVMEEDLTKAVRKAAHSLRITDNREPAPAEDRQTPSISIFDGEQYIILKENDIMRMEAEGSYTRIISSSHDAMLTSNRLGHYEKQLSSNFFRCHKSHLINLQQISKVSKGKSGYITLLNHDMVPISLTRKEQLHQMLNL